MTSDDDLLYEELRYIRGIGRKLAERLVEDIKNLHWLAADREAQRAEAWDSGHKQGFDDAWHISSGTYSKPCPNPHREADDE